MSSKKKFYIERTCSEVIYTEDGKLEGLDGNKSLIDFRANDAYILLGEPGAGKTRTFEYEATQPSCKYIKAREFITFDIQQEWKSKVLFIDGLDEVRAGSNNGLIPLDAIRNKLLKLGKPAFRLSCREADWLDNSDRLDLQEVTACGQVSVLHLDELKEEDIRNFARKENPELNIQQFIDWSHKHVIMPMLGNPQVLKLIVKAISGNKWPDNKTDIYQIACERLVLENNESYQLIKNGKDYSENQLLGAAGKLFAHQLIAGLEGYSVIKNSSTEHTPYYGKIFEKNIGVLDSSLKTNLFKQGVNTSSREPAHRSIAEYLAARFLSVLVEEKGLPVRRLLSLITTVDGNVASSLRGVFAWFLTLCPGQRSLLLNRDPLGVILYGDVRTFSTEQKKSLFYLLYEEAEKHPGFRSDNRMNSPFGALATTDMENVIKNFLGSISREPANQSLVDCVLDAVEQGEVLPGLADSLLAVVKDYTWWSGVRLTALRALLKLFLEDQSNKVLQLLEDIQKGRIEDREDELLGELLTQLYPKKIKPSNVFDYLHLPKNDLIFGSYHNFWEYQLIDQTTQEVLPELLDQLSQRKELKDIIFHNYSSYDSIGELLLKGVSQFGDRIKISRLYDWLSTGLDKYKTSMLDTERSENKEIKIQLWLSDRPNLYKALIVEGVSRSINDDKPWNNFHDITAMLYNAEAPDDIGSWYLEQAEIIDNDEIARAFFREAVFLLYSEVVIQKFNLDTINSWVKSHPEYIEFYQSMLVEDGEQYEKRINRARKKLERSAGQLKKKTDYLNYIIDNKNEIKKGKASPAIFHDLAFAYYGHLMDAKGETAHARVSSMVNNSAELTQYALTGLKKTIFRDDLPSVDEIIKTSLKSRTYYLSHAVLAGLEERNLTDNSEWLDITDSHYEKAIAFQLVEHTGTTPVWFTQLLHTNPDLVSKVFIQYVSACVRVAKDHISGLHQLSHDSDWKSVAKNSALGLLEKFPVRTKNSQMSNIDNLLKAALEYSDQSELFEIINNKLKLSSMNMAQRSRWLSTGLILSPEKYEKDVISFMGNSVTRVRAIADFITSKYESWRQEINLPVSIIGIMIRILGSLYKPYSIRSSSTVTMEMHQADEISGFIRKLSKIDDYKAVEKLEELIELKELEEWQYELKAALYGQTKRLRDASFIQPGIDNVVKTLSNEEPANAADLMALTLDNLEVLAEKIRNSNTNDYNQYWNTDSYNKPVNPKVEEACRDALLSDLKIPLEKLNIQADKECYFVKDKRADIKFSYLRDKRIVVPVEIKRDFHADVWKSMWSQLIKQYTIDPDAQGYGVYVVFWFGTGNTPPPPEGRKPTTANEMKKLLLTMMSEEEKRLIGLCVIDCSISED